MTVLWRRGEEKTENPVSVLGVGMTPFGTHPDKTLAELYTEPLLNEALPGSNLEPSDLYRLAQNDDIVFHYGNHVGGRDYDTKNGLRTGRTNVAAEIPDLLGIPPAEMKRHEAACASSAAALHSAYHDVASGRYDVAVVGGSEKLKSVDLQDATDALATASASSLTFPETFAELTDHYVSEYDVSLDDVLDGMAHIGVKNRRYGVQNPKAQIYGKDRFKDTDVGDAVDSPVMDATTTDGLFDADPLRLYDFCDNADGGSVAILASDDVVDELGVDDPIRIVGTAQRSGGTITAHGARVVEPDFETSRRKAADAAYEMAGVDPDDIDVAEVHDCFTIDEIKAVEDLGFVEHGAGYEAARNHELDVGGTIPTNLSGGLIANGHPVGATGTRQLYSLVKMLRNDPEYDYLDGAVDDVDTALIDTMGGDLGTSVVTILEK